MEDGWPGPVVVRRAYFKLVAKYHPDKNTEGREMFGKTDTAYDLPSNDAGRSSMLDAHLIVLFRQAQSIMYSRKELSEYKYASYGQLILTIDLEAQNAPLFQEGGGICRVQLSNWQITPF